MAIVASAPQGQTAFALRDWVVVYLMTWIAPVPVGLIMLVVPLLISWALRITGATVAADSGLMLVFGLGWLVLFAPALTWIGLIVSVPLVWSALRLACAGWGTFVVGGLVSGWIASWVLDGMTPLAPMAIGVASALFLRLVMGLLRPQAFWTENL